MKFKKLETPVSVSEEPFYALCNGYILPEELLEDNEEAIRVNLAVATIENFIDEAEEAGVIELQ